MNPYTGVILSCLAVASAMLIVFVGLILHRWWSERSLTHSHELRTAVSRGYIQRIAGHRPTDAVKCSRTLRLAAVGHLLLLVRGVERDRLKELAELDGLLSVALRKSRSLRSARRIDAVRILQQFGSTACIARLRQMMKSDADPDVQLNAAFALAAEGMLPPPRETIAMLGMFEREPSRLDVALLRALAPQHVDHLKLILADDIPPRSRAMLIDALGWSGDMTVLPTLEHAACSDNPELRCAALRAAAQIGHPGVPWVIDLLDDDSPIVRLQAANSCAALRLAAAIPRLRELQADEALWVRLRAGEALAVLTRDTATKAVA